MCRQGSETSAVGDESFASLSDELRQLDQVRASLHQVLGASNRCNGVSRVRKEYRNAPVLDAFKLIIPEKR